MEDKQVYLIILLIILVFAAIGMILLFKTSNTGDATYMNGMGKIQGRPRPGDWNYQGAQPYSNTPRNMPNGQTQQDTFIRPGVY
jgi:hypothetical protein